MFPVKFAMGYAYGSDFIPITPNKNAIWWAGLGGSSCVIDQENRTCFSYVMNQMKASMFRWALFRRGIISVGIVSIDVGVAGRWLPNGLQVWVPAPIRELSTWFFRCFKHT